MASLLEDTRKLHEDIERLERLIVAEFKKDAKSHKEKLLQAHRVRYMLDKIQERSKELLKIYEDEDGARKADVAKLRDDTALSSFYARLKDVRDDHARFPSTDLTGPDEDANMALLPPEPRPSFSGEEGFGRFLDLYEHHNLWRNSKFGDKDIDYFSYVAHLNAHWSSVSRSRRLTAAYKTYMTSLLSYLQSFYERSQPLSQIERAMQRTEEQFEAAWEQGQIYGWEDKARDQGNDSITNCGGGDSSNNNNNDKTATIDFRKYPTVEKLMELGGDALKAELMRRGLKCGGTVQQRAERLLAVKGKKKKDIDKSLLAKGGNGNIDNNNNNNKLTTTSTSSSAAKEVALLEAKVSKLCSMLESIIEDTKGRIEKRQAQTYEEIMAEKQAEAEADGDITAMDGGAAGGGGSEGEEDEDDYIYNPLKIPLGWDGKPIPYWLYKLHGLNIEYKCEICGNATYHGRRAFEKHFKEFQHLQGMKALGIPNTKEFYEVTSIADAQELWRNLQSRQQGGFRAEEHEEYEDDMGNVYNRKTYLDLKRQGLI